MIWCSSRTTITKNNNNNKGITVFETREKLERERNAGKVGRYAYLALYTLINYSINIKKIIFSFVFFFLIAYLFFYSFKVDIWSKFFVFFFVFFFFFLSFNFEFFSSFCYCCCNYWRWLCFFLFCFKEGISLSQTSHHTPMKHDWPLIKKKQTKTSLRDFNFN